MQIIQLPGGARAEERKNVLALSDSGHSNVFYGEHLRVAELINLISKRGERLETIINSLVLFLP